MIRTRNERRAGALERARSYEWKNSKAKRRGDTKEQWEKRNAEHIAHLESIKSF